MILALASAMGTPCDAYHSLSIEGYSVTPELIERVRSGEWNPDDHFADRESRDALAARGYWQTFQAVKTAVKEILTGANPGALIRTAHREWYRELFRPCVAAGLLKPGALAGYRNDAVHLSIDGNINPFATFIAARVKESMKQHTARTRR